MGEEGLVMIQNKRDLGGLKTVDGRRNRPTGPISRMKAICGPPGRRWVTTTSAGKLQMDPDLVERFKAAVLE